MELNWTSRSEWGSPGLSHRANEGAWKFLAHRVGDGWTVRGWKYGEFALYDETRTLADAKARALSKFLATD